MIYSCVSGDDSGFDELSTDTVPLRAAIKYNMRKSLDLDQEGCYLQAGKKGCLEECGFNATAKTIFIVHGWTVICLALYFLFVRVHLVLSFTPPKKPNIGRM